jgi:hypothetical protein
MLGKANIQVKGVTLYFRKVPTTTYPTIEVKLPTQSSATPWPILSDADVTGFDKADNPSPTFEWTAAETDEIVISVDDPPGITVNPFDEIWIIFDYLGV